MMGTEITIALVGASTEEAERGFAAAFPIFERVEREMNEWKEDSALSQVNRSAGAGEGVRVSSELCEVVRLSLEGARRTNGLFDPTWASLRGLWRFGANQEARVPSPAKVRQKCPLVDHASVEVSDDCAVRLARKGMQLGLGGIAKGWSVDQAVAALRQAGFQHFLVQAGGDLYAAGKRGGRPWRVGIREPRGGRDELFASLELSDQAFSTSGDYERFFEVGGRRYHHLIDPRTCYPATSSRSASVLARAAVEAEILTKATFILGGQQALALAERNGAQLVLVTSDNQVLHTAGLKGRLTYSPPRPAPAAAAPAR